MEQTLPGMGKPAAPTHVVAQPGDARSLCGLKEPFPCVAAAHVAAHVNGWGMVVCHACAAKSEEAS